MQFVHTRLLHGKKHDRYAEQHVHVARAFKSDIPQQGPGSFKTPSGWSGIGALLHRFDAGFPARLQHCAVAAAADCLEPRDCELQGNS